MKFRQIHDFYSQQPISKLWLTLSRGSGADNSEEFISQAIGIGKAWSNFKHECQSVSFLI